MEENPAMKVTILGAGTIASALTIPISDNGHRINLWGTPYDKDILRELSAGRQHPRLKKTLSTSVHIFQPEEIEEALQDAEAVILGVSSQGVAPVLRKAAKFMQDNQILLSVPKGVVQWEDNVHLMASGIRKLLKNNGMGVLPDIVLMAGPSIAAELARRTWTPVDFACEREEAARTCSRIAKTKYFRTRVSGDVNGTEICLGFKNVYSIALSWPSGLSQGSEGSMSNARSFLFMVAINELERLVRTSGGKPETVYGRPGLGDFVTTSESGRNGMFGQLLGEGHEPAQAFEILQEKGVGVVEGYENGKAARELVDRFISDKKSVSETYPLLNEICNVLYRNKPVEKAMSEVFEKVESSPYYN